jgi:phage terminase small subunit
MRGRRPKPTHLKVLMGNPGKRPLNANEPRPEVAIPDCPVELGEVARREWDRMAPQLASLRILTHLDRAALAAYCGAYSRSRISAPEARESAPLDLFNPGDESTRRNQADTRLLRE